MPRENRYFCPTMYGVLRIVGTKKNAYYNF